MSFNRGYTNPLNAPIDKKPTSMQNVTMLPDVMSRITKAKHQGHEYRVVLDTDTLDPQDKNYRRVTIVVNKEGKLLNQYFG
jgi:hypothetical protein